MTVPLRTASAIVLTLAFAAACSQKGGGAAAPGSSAAPAAAASSAPAGNSDQATGPVIPASEMPALKAGFWEVTETEVGKQSHTDRHCESGKRRPLTMGKNCTNFTLHRTLLGGYVIDGACSFGKASFAVHMVAKGDFNGGYTVDSTSKIKLSPDAPEEVHQSHQDAHYVGPCPAGEEADDTGDSGDGHE